MTTEKSLNPNKLNAQPKLDDNHAIVKPVPAEEVMDILRNSGIADCDPKFILKSIGGVIAKLRSDPPSDEKGIEKGKKELSESLNMGMSLVALDKHYLMAESVGNRYRPFVIQFAKQITEEYQCKTPSEKALAETAAGAYGRVLELSSKVSVSLNLEYLSSIKTSYYAMLDKQLDRAYRQFTSALLVLKQMKSPSLEVNISAKTAFVAQNQQLNSVSTDIKTDNQSKAYENIEPK